MKSGLQNLLVRLTWLKRDLAHLPNYRGQYLVAGIWTYLFPSTRFPWRRILEKIQISWPHFHTVTLLGCTEGTAEESLHPTNEEINFCQGWSPPHDEFGVSRLYYPKWLELFYWIKWRASSALCGWACWWNASLSNFYCFQTTQILTEGDVDVSLLPIISVWERSSTGWPPPLFLTSHTHPHYHYRVLPDTRINPCGVDFFHFGICPMRSDQTVQPGRHHLCVWITRAWVARDQMSKTCTCSVQSL